MKRNKIAIFLVSFFILLCAVFAFYYYKTSLSQTRQPKGLAFLGDPTHKVRDFKFVNQDSQYVTKADIDGKIVVVEYFFTTCKGICPMMSEQMSRVYEEFKNNDDILILSHTVDPKRDTVGALKEYAQRYGADGKHWMFLTGDKKSLYDQARYSYLVTAADSSATDIDADFIHSNNFIIVDRNGKVRAHQNDNGNVDPYDGTDSASVTLLIKDLHNLLLESQQTAN